jgi:translation initiation factor IF-3
MKRNKLFIGSRASKLALIYANKVKNELADISQVDQEASLEGRQLLMILSPLKRK